MSDKTRKVIEKAVLDDLEREFPKVKTGVKAGADTTYYLKLVKPVPACLIRWLG